MPAKKIKLLLLPTAGEREAAPAPLPASRPAISVSKAVCPATAAIPVVRFRVRFRHNSVLTSVQPNAYNAKSAAPLSSFIARPPPSGLATTPDRQQQRYHPLSSLRYLSVAATGAALSPFPPARIQLISTTMPTSIVNNATSSRAWVVLPTQTGCTNHQMVQRSSV